MTQITAYKAAYQSNNNLENRIAFTRQPSQVSLNPAAAFVTTQMMKSVVEVGTGAIFIPWRISRKGFKWLGNQVQAWLLIYGG